jgi:uracil-DNA glycosylase
MPRGTPKIFRFRCPSCQALNTANCRKCGAVYKFDPMNAPGEKRIQQRVWFGERQWQRIKARAIVTPGIGSASEFVRLACETILEIPPHWLISSD